MKKGKKKGMLPPFLAKKVAPATGKGKDGHHASNEAEDERSMRKQKRSSHRVEKD